MPVGSEHSLEAIPESAAISHLSTSARSSPRSTSDNPARSLQPISQHSRLLQPTLSWQAKAGWIPEPALTSAPTSAEPAAEAHSSTAAFSARSQALAAGRRTSLIEPTSSFKDRGAAMADGQEAAGGAMMPTSSAAPQSDNSLAAQQKTDSLSGMLHAELAKRGKAPAATWQQQRLQLRPISQPSSPRSNRSGNGSPVGGQRYTDASVDTLMQQRAKLKHVQTSSKGLLPGTQLAAVPAVQQRQQHAGGAAAAQVSAAVKPPAHNPGPRTTAQSTGAVQQMPKLQSMQPISSQTSQLRNKFSQLTDLLQSTALQRGISLSEVAVPATRKPSKDQPKRSSLDEIRTNFRSFTQGSSSGAEARNAPLRRVSTGAITPAFMKEKDRKDKALLESLGVADAGVAEEEEERVWHASSAQQPSAVLPQQSSASQQTQDGFQDGHSTSSIGANPQVDGDSGVSHTASNGSSDQAAHQTARTARTGVPSTAVPVDTSDIHLSSVAVAERKGQFAAAIDSTPTAQAISADGSSKEYAASEDHSAAIPAPSNAATPAVSYAASMNGFGTHEAGAGPERVDDDSAAHAQGQDGAGTGSVVSSRRPSWVTETSYTAVAEEQGPTQGATDPQSDELSQSKESSNRDFAAEQSVPAVKVDITLGHGTASENAQGKPDGAADAAIGQESDVPKQVGLCRKLLCCATQTRQ